MTVVVLLRSVAAPSTQVSPASTQLACDVRPVGVRGAAVVASVLVKRHMCDILLL